MLTSVSQQRRRDTPTMTDDFLRPTRAEADRDAHEDRLDAERTAREARPHRIRCPHQGGSHDHASAAEVRACRAGEEAHAEDEARAEAEAAHAEDVAYARDRE